MIEDPTSHLADPSNGAAPKPPFVDPTPMEQFAKTSTAARLSGSFNETAGFFKRTFGQLTDDTELKEAGDRQQMIGKVHRLAGSVREVREVAFQKLIKTRSESEKLLRKHGNKLLDLVSEFLDDIKNRLK
jgi:uncharacterized protein YjbJ (UPF0337 family)